MLSSVRDIAPTPRSCTDESIMLTIPESTVEFQGDSAFVQLVKQEQPEQVFEKHPVKVGLSDGIKIEIQEGLAATDKVRGAAIDPNKK